MKRRDAGETYKSIADSYGVSCQRIRQIYSHQRQKREISTLKPVSDPARPEESILYHLIMDFESSAGIEYNSTIPRRAYNALQHEWVRRTDREDNCPPVVFLAALSEDQLTKLRNVGASTRQFLLEVKASLPDMVILPEHLPERHKEHVFSEYQMQQEALSAGLTAEEEASDLFRYLTDISPHMTKEGYIWVYDCLRRAWKDCNGEDSGLPTIAFVQNLTDAEIENLPNSGYAVYTMLKRIKNELREMTL